MYTNVPSYGGNFKDVLDKVFPQATNVTIASGYTSLDAINKYYGHFCRIAKNGGTARLLLGMAFYEGLDLKKHDRLRELDQDLCSHNPTSGVYVINGRKYHGKVYHFTSENEQKEAFSEIYVGSSNFSASGIEKNIECTIPLDVKNHSQMITFLDYLHDPIHALSIRRAAIPILGKTKTVVGTVEQQWSSLGSHAMSKRPKLTTTNTFSIDLRRLVDKEKSSLNTYFGKGRLNRANGIVTPRPWYEIELIASQKERAQAAYPHGDFLAYTDDGLVIPMRTQGDFDKNIRSKDSLQIFGIWLKRKLEKTGALRKYKPVTNVTLDLYGNDVVTFTQIGPNEYYMAF